MVVGTVTEKVGINVHSATVTCPLCDGLTSVSLRRHRSIQARHILDYYMPPEQVTCNRCGRTFTMKVHQPLVVTIPQA